MTNHRIKIRVEMKNGKRTAVSSKSGSTIQDIMKRLGLKPDMYVAVKNGANVPIDEPLSDGDCIKLLEVASGG